MDRGTDSADNLPILGDGPMRVVRTGERRAFNLQTDEQLSDTLFPDARQGLFADEIGLHFQIDETIQPEFEWIVLQGHICVIG